MLGIATHIKSLIGYLGIGNNGKNKSLPSLDRLVSEPETPSTETESSPTKEPDNDYIDLESLLSQRPMELEKNLRINQASFEDLNFGRVLGLIDHTYYRLLEEHNGFNDDPAYYPHYRTEIEIGGRLKRVPTKITDIRERQAFFKELYYNPKYFDLILSAIISLADVCRMYGVYKGFSGVVTNEAKFHTYIQFLAFILNINRANEVASTETSLFPFREISELIDKDGIQVTEDLVEQFQPAIRELGNPHFYLTQEWEYHHEENPERRREEWKERVEAAIEFAERMESKTQKFQQFFNQGLLTSKYNALKSNNPDDLPDRKSDYSTRRSIIERNTSNANSVYEHLNSSLEKLAPVLRTIGNYFYLPPFKAAPVGIQKFLHDLEFNIAIIAYMKSLEQKGLPVSFPEILQKEERKMKVKDGVELYVASTQDAVLNDILHDPETSCFFTTGPNGSIKTTYSRQVGQTYVMSMHGAPIIAQPGAKVSIIDGVYSIFDKKDDPEGKAGTYETQLRRLDKILRKATPYSLVLLDEVDVGTDYEQALDDARDVVDVLARRGTATYITSHVHEIAEGIQEGKYPHTINLASEIIDENSRPIPTHRIIRGKSEKSYGHLIREKVGFNPGEYHDVTERMKNPGLHREK